MPRVVGALRTVQNPRVARPLRKLWQTRTHVRRRHRTWIFAMAMATCGWMSWWTSLALLHFFPDVAPSLRVTTWIASSFAAVGFLAAVWAFRAKAAWLLFLLVPFFANGSLLLVPWALRTLRVVDSHTPAQTPRADPFGS